MCELVRIVKMDEMDEIVETDELVRIVKMDEDELVAKGYQLTDTGWVKA